jgi:hypothetical protein
MKKEKTKEEKIKILNQQIKLTDAEKKIIYDFKMKKLNKTFEKYCREGDFEMIQYLLTSPDLELNYNLHYSNGGFNILCQNNQINIIKYLLTSPNLEKHSKLQAGTNIAIDIVCEHGHLELIKYFLTSPKLKEHSNIYDYNSRAIESAYKSEKADVINYLIDDYQIELNRIDPMVKMKIDAIEKRINSRILKADLEKNLVVSTANSKKHKI